MNGSRKAEWFDDARFWRELYPFLFPEQRIGRGEEEVAGALALVPHIGRNVLDLCCGPGRHSAALARRGMRVTGVDATELLLDRARERVREEGLEVEWVHCDMRDFVRPDTFDLAINMFSSLGYFESDEDELRVLENVHRSLRSGGALLVDLKPKESLADGFQPTEATRLADGSMLVQFREIVGDWSRLRNEWILVRDGHTRSFVFELTIYSGSEIRDLLHRAGFSTVKLYGDLEGSAFGLGSERLIAVSVKD